MPKLPLPINMIIWGESPSLPLVAPGGGLSRGPLRFRAAHRSRWSRPSHPLRISAATCRLTSDEPPTGQAAPKNGAASPYQAHRPRRPRQRIGATEPSVHSVFPVGHSIAHYGPHAPPLRPVPRSTHPPTADTTKLQHYRQRGVTLPDGQPAAPTTAYRPGPPLVGRPASSNPAADASPPHRPRLPMRKVAASLWWAHPMRGPLAVPHAPTASKPKQQL